VHHHFADQEARKLDRVGGQVAPAKPSKNSILPVTSAVVSRSVSMRGIFPLQLERRMDEVQVGQSSYQMPPQVGFTVAHFLTVADLKRSADFYKTVFDGEIVSMGDGNAPPYIKIANIWLIINVGGGPTPDKPTVTLKTPDPNQISSFMNIRVADIQACYKLWKSRGATFLTEPIKKYGETRCYIRDPDGYIIEVGQSDPGFTYG